MRNKIGTICMVVGTVLVLAALSLFLFNQWDAQQAAAAAESILPQVQERIEAGSEEQSYPDPYDPEMTVVEIDGYGYIGYLSIPALELELPVMSEWDYARLKIAPCRYSGSVKTGDLVLAAHNYVQHFGNLSSLQIGDAVLFTDMDGTVWRYEVKELDTLSPTAVEEMTAGEYDLTLFTCTYSGQSRTAVRCVQVGSR